MVGSHSEWHRLAPNSIWWRLRNESIGLPPPLVFLPSFVWVRAWRDPVLLHQVSFHPLDVFQRKTALEDSKLRYCAFALALIASTVTQGHVKNMVRADGKAV